MQIVVMEKLISWRSYPVLLLHRNIHSLDGSCKSLKGNQIIVLTELLDAGIFETVGREYSGSDA